MTIKRVMNHVWQIPVPSHMRDMFSVGGFLYRRVSNEWVHCCYIEK